MKNFFITIYYVFFCLTLLYGLYFLISGLFFWKKKKEDKNGDKIDKNHHFAILIAARNEGEVIGNLLDSLNKLNYPKKDYDIYVIPNNCTDDTESISIENGANIIKCTVNTKTKGDVLKFTFDKLKNHKEIDAYLIFDSDNIVHKDFLVHMNEALCKGYNVAEGFRDAKNPSDNWISGSYTIFYLFQNIFFNKTRDIYSASASINGTGFMIRKSLIDKNGFETYSLTEDVEFTGQCALNKEKIAFVEDAVTYDEYPTKFIASWKQRKRWSAGIITCMKRYSFNLFKDFIKTGNLSSLDLSLVYLGPLMQVISFILFVMLIIFRILGIQLNDVFSYFFSTGIIYFCACFIIGILFEVFALVYKKKSLHKMLPGILFFFIFILSWIPINISCFLKKYNKWEEIKHDRNITLKDLKD